MKMNIFGFLLVFMTIIQKYIDYNGKIMLFLGLVIFVADSRFSREYRSFSTLSFV